MYGTLYRMIDTGEYTLTDMTAKINTFWAEGQITADQRTELLEMAVSNLSVEQERPDTQTTLEALAARVEALEEAVAALQSSSGDGDTGSTTTYEEWTTWDGVSNKYQYGAIVAHNGTLWVSTYNGQNVWEPGVTGTETLWQQYESED
ncbi:MAG: hypothetical protein LUG55_03455 [Clostridiales bacterium]|nr:hypothetical protein [Clostridiales bacterium]